MCFKIKKKYSDMTQCDGEVYSTYHIKWTDNVTKINFVSTCKNVSVYVIRSFEMMRIRFSDQFNGLSEFVRSMSCALRFYQAY